MTRDLKDLFEIAVDLSLLEAVVVPEPALLRRLRLGQQALVLLAEAPGEGLPGFVKMVAADEVVIEFTNPTPAVRPGLTAQVRIRLR